MARQGSSRMEQGKDAKCPSGCQFPVNRQWCDQVRATLERLWPKGCPLGWGNPGRTMLYGVTSRDRSWRGITRAHLGKELPKSRTRASGQTSLRIHQYVPGKSHHLNPSVRKWSQQHQPVKALPFTSYLSSATDLEGVKCKKEVCLQGERKETTLSQKQV